MRTPVGVVDLGQCCPAVAAGSAAVPVRLGPLPLAPPRYITRSSSSWPRRGAYRAAAFSNSTSVSLLRMTPTRSPSVATTPEPGEPFDICPCRSRVADMASATSPAYLHDLACRDRRAWISPPWFCRRPRRVLRTGAERTRHPGHQWPRRRRHESTASWSTARPYGSGRRAGSSGPG